MFEQIDEFEQLKYFRLAYEAATGEWLEKSRKSERPDFICKRPDNSLVGIEFTLITRDPDSSSWASILDGVEYMDGLDGKLLAEAAITVKGQKRSEPTWQLSESAILVISTSDCPIAEMKIFFDEDIENDCRESGFSEVWIADHTEVDAYGTIELFCLWPRELRGYYPRPWTGKPYG